MTFSEFKTWTVRIIAIAMSLYHLYTGAFGVFAWVFERLKNPVCTGKATTSLLDVLDARLDDQEFNGDLWTAVAWAESQGKIDLRSPPTRP